MRDVLRRLERLEHASQAGVTIAFALFLEEGETTAHAIARRWPEGAPANANLTFFSWLAPSDGMEAA